GATRPPVPQERAYAVVNVSALRYVPLSFFFFQRHADPPALHSFPTRRSSDLILTLSSSDGSPISIFWKRRASARSRSNEALYSGDRKSTRLNSSHLGISYAVFCLKKKKPLQRTSRAIRTA